MKSLITIFLTCFSTCLFGQKLECRRYENGKFKIIDPEVGNSIIERNDSTQIEYGEDSKLKLEFDVKWINDCTYTLELSRVIENPENIQLPEGMILTIRILETKQNSYVQETSSNLFSMVRKTEMIRIE